MRKKSVHAPRPAYLDKTGIILRAVKSLVAEQATRTHLDYGFTMAQIAERAGYARSQRFMETLYSMCDDGLLEKQEWKWSDGVVKTRCVFRLKSEFTQKAFA